MSSSSSAIAGCTLVVASLSGIPAARGQDDHAEPPREAAHDTRHPVTVTINPLGFVMQRYGANVEIVPVPHHAFVGSAYLQSIPIAMVRSASGFDAINDDPGSTLGGELGYRLYTGRRGADGFFVGGSYVTMTLAYPRLARNLASLDLVRFNASGAALDIGVQKVTDVGFTVGGGIGVMYVAYELPNDNHRIPLTLEPHVLPRLLLTAGWSF
jgi:hypothetical protein